MFPIPQLFLHAAEIKMSNDKHEKLLINPQVQKRILWRVVASLAIYHLVFWHVLFLFHLMSFQVDVLNGERELNLVAAYVDFCAQNFPLILTSCAILPLFSKQALKFSRRVVGPLVPITKALRDIRHGERVESLSHREDDLLVEFQAEFNQFIEWYNQKQGTSAPAVDDSESQSDDSGDETTLEQTSFENGVLNDLEDLKNTTMGIRSDREDDLSETNSQVIEPLVEN